MKSNVEKSVKRWLKRKVSITLGLMVSFLISGTITYSENVEIKFEDGKLVATEVDSGKLYKNEFEYVYLNNGIHNGEINFSGNMVGEKELRVINVGIIKGTDSNLLEGNIGTSSVEFNNYGIVLGKYTNIAIPQGEDKGLTIIDTDGEIKVSTTGKINKNIFFNDDRGNPYQAFLINGIKEEGAGYIAKSLTYNDILELKPDGFLDNLIINVVGDEKEGKYNSLIVEKQFSIDNSYINGYKTAIKFDDKLENSIFYGNGVIVNGGEYSFLGSDRNNRIILGYTHLIPTNTINGNISLGAGNDEINIDRTEITGKIDFGIGNDSLIASNSTIKGDILFEGNGNITLNNKVTIDGKVTVKGDTTNLTLGKDTQLSGNTTFDIQSKNKNLILGYNVNNNSDVEVMKNQVSNEKLKEFAIKLANGGNSNVNLQGMGINTSITGGNGNDIFIIGENETGIKIDDISSNDKDTLKLSFNTNENTSFTGGYKNIENLQLADGENTLNTSGLQNFSTITGGRGNDNFINVDKYTLGKIVGGNGIDTITMGEGLIANNDEINTVFDNSIEKLILANEKNELSLDDLKNVNKIDFTNGDNKVILGAEGVKQDFIFNENTKFNGTLNLDLKGNTAQIGSSTLSNGKITLNNSFIENGKLSFTNGTIKFELGKGIYFDNGVSSRYGLTLGNITLDETAHLDTYSFLKVENNNTELAVKSWTELTQGLEGEYGEQHADNYDQALKNYNKENHESLTGVFNSWTEKEIADFIVANEEIKENETITENDKTYTGKVVEGKLTIDTSNGVKLGFNTISAGNLEIKNGNSESGTIDFGGTVTIKGGVDATNYNGDLTLNFNNSENKIELGDVAFGNATNNELKIEVASNISSIGNISAEGNVNINITSVGKDSDGFNRILLGANNGKNNSIKVTDSANVDINTNYGGNLTFNGTKNNVNIEGTEYTGTIELGANSTFGVTNSKLNGTTLKMSGGNINFSDHTYFEGEGLTLSGSNNNISYDLSKNNSEIILNGENSENNNTLILGKGASTLESDKSVVENNYTLSGSITNLASIMINENLSLDSKLKLDGTKNITIGAGKELGLNVDYDKTQNGKVIGHALYNSGTTVDNTNGKLVVGTADAKTNATISMGTSSIVNGENVVVSGSINHKVEYDLEKNEINVIVKDSIVDGNDKIKYDSLNKIHESIVNANKIDLMGLTGSIQKGDKTEDEAIKAQLEFYGKIYTSTPYAYSNDISRETTNMVNDSIMDSRFKADEGKWIHYGAISGQGYDDDNSYYGRGYYNSVDLGTTEVNVKSSIYSAYYMGEYGKTDKLALGYVMAGNSSNTDIGESNLDGNGIYLGTYAKYNTGKIELIAGLGYQHNYYKADRRVSNDYQSMSVDKKYTDDTLTAYSGVRYTHSLANNLTVEPYARLSLTHVMQDDIKETDRGDLSISVDGKDFTTIESEIGVNLVKSVDVKDGKINLIAGLGAEVMLDGYERENLTAKINGSTSSFDIISDEEENFRGKISLGVEYEKTNGVFYNAKGSYIRTEDNSNYKFEVGIGYKF